MAANQQHTKGRELRLAAELAALLPAGAIAQLEATIEDPDNRCCACGELIQGPAAETVLFRDETLTLLRLAHPDCMRSGLYPASGLAESLHAPEGFDMATVLALRRARPRALLFLEPSVLTGPAGQDPLEVWALALGLSPVSGEVERIAPPPTDAFTIARRPGGLALRHRLLGTDSVCAERAEVDDWWRAARGRAMVVSARGLGLRRPERAIEEALLLRPAWAAIAALED